MELNYYEYEHNEYIPPHPTLNWKKIFSDFLKYVIVPILFFFFMFKITGKGRIDDIDFIWIQQYILLCAVIGNIGSFITLNFFSLPTFLIGAFFSLITAIPKVIWWFIRMNFYILITIIRICRLLYFQYQVKNM